MKLISNTLFGKYCKSKEKEFKTRLEYLEWYEKTRNNFDEFLEQPLKLERFIPCDDDEEILKPQYIAGKEVIYNELVEEFVMDKVKEYNEAKENVLFENIPIAQAKWLVNTFSTIESLSDITNTITPIYLTESAIKQIGL